MIKCKYFVYLLKSEISNRTYVGYTIDVKRRLKQHNGLLSGGAKKTSTKRPWSIVLFISGFEFEKTALQYEFCIQHTKKYKRGTGVLNKMKIMKSLLKQKRICSSAPLNTEFKRIIFFSNSNIKNIWNNL